MNRFVIDAYAWIEYFDGTNAGEKVKSIIENTQNSIYTNVITVAELINHFKRKNKNFEEVKKVLISLSSFYPVTFEFAEECGNLYAEIKKDRKHMGLADCFVLLTAKKLNAKVVTGDEDFRNLKETIMIK